MMRLLVIVALALPLAAAEPITFPQRLRMYAAGTCGAGAFAGAGAAALIGQARDEPHEWGQGSAGFGRRLGYRQARRAAGGAIELGAGMLLREDPRYFRSDVRGAWRRTRDAMRATFVVDGRPAWARFSGIYGGAMLSLAWYPRRYTAIDGFRMGSISLGARVAGNVFREFWPEIRRVVLRRK